MAPQHNLGGMSGFMPLLDEPQALLPSRGQRLPSLGQSRSATNLFSLPRRARVFSMSDDDSIDAAQSMSTDGGPLTRRSTIKQSITGYERDNFDPNEERRVAHAEQVLMTPQMRSMRLIGNSNPRYRWQRYYKTPEELKQYSKPLRRYYERVNVLIARYLYIDRLLDSSLIHNLMSEYQEPLHAIPEEAQSPMLNGMTPPDSSRRSSTNDLLTQAQQQTTKMKRTPKDLYKFSDESTPLLLPREDEPDAETQAEDMIDVPFEEDEGEDSGSAVVTIAIYINLVANVILLAAKIAVIVLTDSLSVLASLVDAALDFLSTAIVWATTYLIARNDQYAYPIGRRRLEPVGVLVFSVIMITSFFQVGLECINRLTGDDHSIVELSIPAVAIMLSTVIIKGFCYFWCRLVKNSSVQALAQDAATDVVFNTFSIIFPLVGFYAKIWWLDALGGLLLSCYVIFNWSSSASEHIRHLSGAAATADDRNVLLYLTMRFAKTIRYIQGLQAYHAGDKLNVEVDIVLEENISLRDSHDLSESLQYVLESVPNVDRAFVHSDYKRENLPSHMNQQA
ncbi:hypothetical protein LTR70_006214 [Exophiala xenobiotica]|uniref:Cation efflux protein transmembrane domain-containing protein n=1 Tax=Lithohypha guttulata TaxID=1690604 RepID=A0ABR0K4V6_9EURO|nr:hypothetical protein LTR24_007334 [Lithohypha guttulata]KAK5316555.1 hypothetical protein LTR70_006214 [Exophiala xenobiotica]